jgi:hypothetical protein
MRGKYIIITVLAFTCGAGAASWYAASQTGLRTQAATHLAAMAQSAVEEKAKAAELALEISEASERFARDQLAQETKMRLAAEQALDKAINRTAQAVRVLADQGNVRKSSEGNSADIEITKEELVVTLAAQGTTKKALDSKLEDLDMILHTLDEMAAKQSAHRWQAHTELENRRLQVRNLNSQLQQAMTTRPRRTPAARRVISRRTPRPSQTWWQSALRGL